MTDAVSAADQLCRCEVSFPGATEYLDPARDHLMHFLAAHGLSGDEELDILLALQEALANAILHGCHNDAAKTVRCTIAIDPSCVEIVVQDPGSGFDPAQANHADPGANFSEHGRGILLIRSLMDDVDYRRNGSELHLRKRRAITHPDAA